MTTFWLNFHVGYACRQSGACCRSGWPIPVERDRVVSIRNLAGRAGDDWLVPAAGAPAEVAGTLALAANGHCVFHDAGCGVYAARPGSCVHFPYVCLVDARGVHVTLSHYCPTAASMLFDECGPIGIVEGPPPLAGSAVPEGLDARESLPPVAPPDRLMSFEALSAWERGAVAAPWPQATGARRADLFEGARRAVPAPLVWPAAPADLEGVWTERVAPAWPDFAPVVARYRAAKVFASWALYLGDGPAAALRLAEMAVGVLEVEAARQCAAAGRPLDADLLKQAIRQADLLMVHYADGRVLSSGTSS